MLKFVCLTLFIAIVSANITFKDCGHGEVTDVDIVHKGKETLFIVTYKANQDTTQTSWDLLAIVGGLELDLATLIPKFDNNGCHETPCPIKKGETKVLTFRVTLPDSVPSIDSDFKAILTGEKRNMFCAIIHNLK